MKDREAPSLGLTRMDMHARTLPHSCKRLHQKRAPKNNSAPKRVTTAFLYPLDGRISFLNSALHWHGSRIGAHQFQDEHSASAIEMALDPLLKRAGPGSMCVFLTLECKRLQKMKKQPRMRDTALVWLPIEAVIAHTPRRRLAPAPFAPARGVTESFGVAA